MMMIIMIMIMFCVCHESVVQYSELCYVACAALWHVAPWCSMIRCCTQNALCPMNLYCRVLCVGIEQQTEERRVLTIYLLHLL